MSDIQYNYYLDRLKITSNEENENTDNYEYDEENTDESITLNGNSANIKYNISIKK